MLKASRRVEYGLMALKWMLQKPEGSLTTAREISDKFGASFETLARTLQSLHRYEVLESIQGAHGGYRIRAKLSEISVAAFCRMIEGDIPFIACDGKSGCDMHHQCNIISPMTVLNFKLQTFLSSVSVSDLLTWDHDVNLKEQVKGK